MKKKFLSLLIAVTMTATLFTACGKSDSKETTTGETTTASSGEIVEKENMNMAVLKGPTAIGFVKAWDDSDAGTASNNYSVTAYGTADEITTGLVQGTIDIAAVPCNLASVLYNKTNGGIEVAGINTLGVLYMVSTDDSIKSVADLKGKTIYSTGQGTTPEYTLNYILSKNGLTAGTDVTVEYKSEATEIASLMSQQENAIAMLPQPYVTTVLMNNTNAKIVLDMTEEWDKISDGSKLVTGVIVVRKEFLDTHEAAFKNFLSDYKASTDYVNANVEDAAALVEKHDIFKAAVAKTAIPKCNITFMDGDDMKTNVESYLSVLFEANPKSVGGKMPADDFYYLNK